MGFYFDDAREFDSISFCVIYVSLFHRAVHVDEMSLNVHVRAVKESSQADMLGDQIYFCLSNFNYGA